MNFGFGSVQLFGAAQSLQSSGVLPALKIDQSHPVLKLRIVGPMRDRLSRPNSSTASRDLLAGFAAPTAGLAGNPKSRARSLRDPARLGRLATGLALATTVHKADPR